MVKLYTNASWVGEINWSKIYIQVLFLCLGQLRHLKKQKRKKEKKKKGKKVVASCAEIEYQALTLDFFFPLMKTTFIDKMMKDTRASKKNQPHKRMEPH